MPSFDIVSEVDMHEVGNAINQANREVTTRFDFKGSNAKFELADTTSTLHAPNEFQVSQMLDILKNKMIKRSIDIQCLDVAEPEVALNETRQRVTVKQGIDQPTAKKITKLIKDSKVKVQVSIQGDKIRVTGKKRDDLQQTISTVKDAKLELALQYVNFRD